MGCTIMLRNNATGEARSIFDESDWKNIEFNWTEGNFGCDCNRALFWHRAGTPNFDDLPDDEIEALSPCGKDGFSIQFVIPDVGDILGEEGEPPNA